MIIEGINECYFFEVENDSRGIIVTCGDKTFNRTSLIINKEKFKKEMLEFIKSIE